jgi:hypothetical protein
MHTQTAHGETCGPMARPPIGYTVPERKPLAGLWLRRAEPSRDTPGAPPARHRFLVISPPGFFHPCGPHAVSPVLTAFSTFQNVIP